MTSGRRESVQRHINNPNKHNGNARVIPFVEYLAGLASGVYSIVSNPSRTKATYNVLNPEDRQTRRSFFDRIQKKVEEKMIDRIAENTVNQTSHHRRLYPIQIFPIQFSSSLLAILEKISSEWVVMSVQIAI